MLNRKLMLVAVAIALPVTMMTFSGVASAKKTGTGTTKCTGITGSISFKPALTTTTPFVAETTTAKITVTGCTGGTPVPTKGTVKQVLKSASGNNSCVGLQTSSSESLTIKWKGVAASTSAYGGYTTGTGGPDSGEGFILTGGTTGGSYPGTGSQASVYSSMTQAQILTACGTAKGLAKLTIVGGTTTL